MGEQKEEAKKEEPSAPERWIRQSQWRRLTEDLRKKEKSRKLLRQGTSTVTAMVISHTNMLELLVSLCIFSGEGFHLRFLSRPLSPLEGACFTNKMPFHGGTRNISLGGNVIRIVCRMAFILDLL